MSFAPPLTGIPRCYGLGNPLLDLVVHVDADFLNKRNMAKGGAYLYDPALHGEDFYETISKIPGLVKACGSATLNTIRAVQGLIGEAGSTAYSGCVGADDNGKVLEALCAEDGVRTFLATSRNDKPTGACGVLVCDADRTMCTNLAACNDYCEAYFREECWNAVETCFVVYSAGFHLTVCPSQAAKLAKYCAANHKLYVTSLSAEFIPLAFGEQLKSVLCNTDILFGNELELAAYAKSHGLNPSDLRGAAKYAAELPFSDGNKDRERVVLCTQGKRPTLVVSNKRGELECAVPELCDGLIVDTSGAGDAFAAGFIYACIIDGGQLPTNLDKACQMGHRAARHVVQQAGFNFDFTDDDRLYK